MKQFLEMIRRIPRWGYVFGIVYFALQYGMYRLGDLLSRVLGTISYAFPCKIPFLDDRIPIVPVFAVIYLFSYVFWICGPIAVSLTGKKHFKNSGILHNIKFVWVCTKNLYKLLALSFGGDIIQHILTLFCRLKS